MRRLALLALALAGCSTKPQYQGDVIVGAFNFTADIPTLDTCTLAVVDGGEAGFGFSGVLSFDTAKQQLFLDTNGDTADDHVGTLTGRHFVLSQSAKRHADPACSETQMTETFEGDLFELTDAGTDCAVLEADGGPLGWPLPGDGGPGSFVPFVACGTLSDVSDPCPGSTTVCRLTYPVAGSRQGGGS